MHWTLKSVAILVVVAIALTILERWNTMFLDGRLYTHLNVGFALVGFMVPILTVGVAGYLVVKIIRAARTNQH